MTKPTFENLKDKYSHFEWYHCIETDFWVAMAHNLYGQWGHVEFPATTAKVDPESVEAWLLALEDFRRHGKSLTRTVTSGRYVAPLPKSERKRK